MRRALLALGVLVGAGLACTTFAFPRPSDSADAGDADSDALADVSVDAGNDADAAGEAAAPAPLLPAAVRRGASRRHRIAVQTAQTRGADPPALLVADHHVER